MPTFLSIVINALPFVPTLLFFVTICVLKFREIRSPEESTPLIAGT